MQYVLQGIRADVVHCTTRRGLFFFYQSLISFWGSACLYLWVFRGVPAVICAVLDLTYDSG